jgi:hypothetical protein
MLRSSEASSDAIHACILSIIIKNVKKPPGSRLKNELCGSGRAFSGKGAWTGLALWLFCWLLLPWSLAEALAWMLIVGAISAFLALNYTGASAITSLSGVKKEMRLAMPAIIASAAVGVILRVILRFTMGG